MAKTLIDLANSLDKLVATIPQQISEGATNVALSVVTDLVWNTPVDTSNAVSNWVVSLDVPSRTEIPPHTLGSFGSSHYASATEAINAAQRILRTKKPGQKIYISNNAPYIRDLNAGSSKQAPAGFVERAVIVGRLESNKIKLKLQ